MSNGPIDDRLLQAQVALDNSLSDGEVQTYLANFGYDVERLNAGKALYDNVNQLHQKQQVEYADQYSATDSLQQALTRAQAEYMRHVKIARIALKHGRGAYQKLGLTGDRKRTLSGWLAQARQFYLNALADAPVVGKLATFGLNQQKLEAAQQLVAEVEMANAAQEKEKGEAQQATLERDRAMDELDEWIGDFFAIAQIALEDKPQLLEKLGIVTK